MKGGIKEVKMNMDKNGEYKQIIIKFGKHHVLNVFEENFKLNFELLSGKHGFKVNETTFDKNMESLSEEIESNHPDKSIERITEKNIFRGEIEKETTYFMEQHFQKFLKMFPNWSEDNRIYCSYLVSESTFHVILLTKNGFQSWWYDMNVDKLYKLAEWNVNPDHSHGRYI